MSSDSSNSNPPDGSALVTGMQSMDDQTPAPPLANPPGSAPIPHLISQSPYTNSLGAQYSSAARLAMVGKDVPTLSAGRIAFGIALGTVVGIVSVVAWVAIVQATHFNLSLIAVGVGVAIGWGVYKGCGQGGNTVCWIAGVIAFILTAIGAVLTIGSYGAWSIFVAIACVVYGTRQAFLMPTMLDR